MVHLCITFPFINFCQFISKNKGTLLPLGKLRVDAIHQYIHISNHEIGWSQIGQLSPSSVPFVSPPAVKCILRCSSYINDRDAYQPHIPRCSQAYGCAASNPRAKHAYLSGSRAKKAETAVTKLCWQLCGGTRSRNNCLPFFWCSHSKKTQVVTNNTPSSIRRQAALH